MNDDEVAALRAEVTALRAEMAEERRARGRLNEMLNAALSYATRLHRDQASARRRLEGVEEAEQQRESALLRAIGQEPASHRKPGERHLKLLGIPAAIGVGAGSMMRHKTAMAAAALVTMTGATAIVAGTHMVTLPSITGTPAVAHMAHARSASQPLSYAQPVSPSRKSAAGGKARDVAAVPVAAPAVAAMPTPSSPAPADTTSPAADSGVSAGAGVDGPGDPSRHSRPEVTVSAPDAGVSADPSGAGVNVDPSVPAVPPAPVVAPSLPVQVPPLPVGVQAPRSVSGLVGVLSGG